MLKENARIVYITTNVSNLNVQGLRSGLLLCENIGKLKVGVKHKVHR
jgi:hypothetical protein